MKAFLLILSMGWSMQAFSQQEYFVFLQAENRQPFYVRMGEKNYSSSSSGHLILSKLKDSVYALTVGFPQNQFPEQDFTVRINKKDRGFEIKNLGEKGWALFDLQSLELINPSKAGGSTSGGASYSLIKRDDDFARLMAGVVNDTAVLYNVVMAEKKAEPVLVSNPVKDTASTEVARVEIKPVDTPKNEVAIIEPKKQEDSVKVIMEEPKADSVKLVMEEPKKAATAKIVMEEPKKPDTVAIAQKQPERDPMKDSVLNPPALPVIHVAREYATDSGYQMIIVDESKDSINIFIPADIPQPMPKKVTDSAKTAQIPENKTVDPVKIAQPKTDSTSLNKTSDLPAKDSATESQKPPPKLVMMNSDCRNFAREIDVDKLRVKLINEKDSEDRIAAAKKAFKSRCFSAQQIKALSELFPYDEQKYKFLEAAYPFVSDTSNFKELVSLLTDPVYIQRFRKLVRLD